MSELLRPTPMGWTRKPELHPDSDHRLARFVTNDEAVSVTLDCYDSQRGTTVTFYGEGLELHLDELDTGASMLTFDLGDNRVNVVLTRANIVELMQVFADAATEYSDAQVAKL